MSSSHECLTQGWPIWLFFWSEAQKVLVFAGPDVVEAQCQRLQVRSKEGGKVLFAADEEEVVMTSEKFTITGGKKKALAFFLMLKHKVDKQHPQFSLFGAIFVIFC